MSFTTVGGTGTISVMTSSNCNWTASENASWVVITSGSNGNGNGFVRYIVSPNLSEPSRTRTAVIVIAGITHTITQTSAAGLSSISGSTSDFITDEWINGVDITTDYGISGTSSTDGSYLIFHPPGVFDITASKAGYCSVTHYQIELLEYHNIIEDFKLRPNNLKATIDIPPNDISIIEGDTVNFQGSVEGCNGPLSYEWDFDSVTNVFTELNPGNIEFEKSGVYKILFTVIDRNDEISTDTVWVSVLSSEDDIDGDLVPNDTDNCPYVENPEQIDIDEDGFGDICDHFPDDNNEWLDTDADGIGNNADMDDDNDGKSDNLEASGPNDGDANNDGIQDSIQSNVVCLELSNAQGYVVLESNFGTSLSNCQSVANPSPESSPAGIIFEYGFFSFTISGLIPGGSTSLSIMLPSGKTPDTYYKYGKVPSDPTDHWYEFSYDDVTGVQIDGNNLTLYFTDALRGDDKLLQDGMVIDLGAPAFNSTIENGNHNSGSGGCFFKGLQNS